jgi:hypothetical protein
LQGRRDGTYIAIPLSLTIIVSRFPHGYGSKAADTQMMEQTGGNMHCQKEGSMFDIAQLSPFDPQTDEFAKSLILEGYTRIVSDFRVRDLYKVGVSTGLFLPNTLLFDKFK